MIVFDLKCAENHVFEAWFRSSDAYEEQREAGQICCPHCGDNHISKSVMAPNISAKSNRRSDAVQDSEDLVGLDQVPVAASAGVPENAEISVEDVKRAAEHMHDVMAKYRKFVEENCENVGDNFAAEARKIHNGESEERGIYGQTTLEESQELLEEGIDIFPVPGAGKLDS
ncbi:DUF1178 family protein [Emcibacter nanhaiensis]|uniref:DUF1178 family protein n=1 Tax=Emcibacter nanhaiensis TaxID=1505037 RepID=A0A501PLU1_9PROT|nr:DUF1178 family protein [Emcibacter nanhaiensis]TPD61393.1 DUF1178 family protein [Emcibacter nanhaiensis]